MTTTHENTAAQRDLDDPTLTAESRAQTTGDHTPVPGFPQGWIGETAVNPVLRHPSGGAVRAVMMRRTQQVLGNRAAQQIVARTKRSPGAEPQKLERVPQEEETKLPGSTPAGGDTQPPIAGVPSQISQSRGEPMAADTRKEMESSFGRKFSDVRVHTDTPAAQMSDGLQADAFTTGRDIYFAQGRYSPRTEEGRRLLAHELTHTVQEQSAPIPPAEADAPLVSSPNDASEVEAERVSDEVVSHKPQTVEERKKAEEAKASGTAASDTAAPDSGVRSLITPASAGILHRQPRKGQQDWPAEVWGDDVAFASWPDVILFPPVKAAEGHWKGPKSTFTPLLGGTFIVDGIPVSYSLSSDIGAEANALMVFGPGLLEQIRIIVTGAEAKRMKTPQVLWTLDGPILLPPDKHPHGSFARDAMLRFSASASANASAHARVDGAVGVFGNALSAGAFAGIEGDARGDVTTNVFTFVHFRWNNGAISIGAILDLEATLNLAFHVAAFAGVKVELRVPEIPVVTDLTQEVSSWPIVGWFVPDLSKWKWTQEYKKKWDVLDKRYSWDLQQRFAIGNQIAAGGIANPEGFSLDKVLADLQTLQKEGDLKDDPEGPGRERRNSDTSAVSAAKASALAQIASAKHAANREKEANSRLLVTAKKAAAVAKKTVSSSSPRTPSLAAIGPSAGDPVADLETRGEKLDDAVESTKELRQRVDALDAPATAADGVSRNEARAGFEAVAQNADALGDKVNNNEDAFAVPAAALPNDGDYDAMRAALRKANDAFDDCFDVVRTEKLFADDQVRNVGNDIDLHPYRDAVVLYQGQALKLWNRVQKLDEDIEKAREWYEKGDYDAGAKTFDELESQAIRLLDDGQTLRKTRPEGDWDAAFVELSGGHLQLQPQFRGKATRSYFYPHDYSTDTKNRMLKEIGSFHTGEDGKIYWEYPRRKSPRRDFWWLLDDPTEQPTLDHLSPTVVSQWNSQGRTSIYAPRKTFYDFAGAKLIVVPQTLNSAAGGREPDSYTPYVTRTFRGAKT